MSNQITLEQRPASTKSQKKQLRAQGKIPAVVYGESIDSVSITVEHKQLSSILRTNPNAVLQMDIPEQGKHPVMIGAIQRDPVTRDILHIDFQQIDVKNPIKVMVRLDIVGEAKGASDGGVLQMSMTELEIECLPHLIPTSITVDVSELGIGDSLFVSDLTLPEDVVAVPPADEVVASVLVTRGVAEDDETDEADEETEQADDAEASENTPAEE